MHLKILHCIQILSRRFSWSFLVTFYHETSLLVGQELKECFTKESYGEVKGFPLGFLTLQAFTYLWNRGFLDIKVSRLSKKAIVKSNQCFDHLIDSLLLICTCCHAYKGKGFGWFYLVLDLNEWLFPYESDTLIAESSRSSWFKSPYKRKSYNHNSF